MNISQKLIAQMEIELMFVDFYVENINEFRAKYGNIQTGGQTMTYDDMLPETVLEFIQGSEKYASVA